MLLSNPDIPDILTCLWCEMKCNFFPSKRINHFCLVTSNPVYPRYAIDIIDGYFAGAQIIILDTEVFLLSVRTNGCKLILFLCPEHGDIETFLIFRRICPCGSLGIIGICFVFAIYKNFQIRCFLACNCIIIVTWLFHLQPDFLNCRCISKRHFGTWLYRSKCCLRLLCVNQCPCYVRFMIRIIIYTECIICHIISRLFRNTEHK